VKTVKIRAPDACMRLASGEKIMQKRKPIKNHRSHKYSFGAWNRCCCLLIRELHPTCFHAHWNMPRGHLSSHLHVRFFKPTHRNQVAPVRSFNNDNNDTKLIKLHPSIIARRLGAKSAGVCLCACVCPAAARPSH
jgi:hypothetical protein